MKKETKEAPLKSDVLTIRLSPKLKYAMELVARNQHRNLSQVMEWALWHALGERPEGIPNLGLGNFDAVLDQLWSPYPSDRLVLLAIRARHLLSYREDVIWRYIESDDRYWIKDYKPIKPGMRVAVVINDERNAAVDMMAIHKDWQQIKREALESVAVQSSQVT